MARLHPDRRSVLAGAAALGVAASAATAVDAALGRPEGTPMILFDPDEPSACGFAARLPAQRVALVGDRVRLARRYLGPDAPSRLTVIGRHADLLLLSEAAREEGYRALACDPFPTADSRGGMFIWTAYRNSGARGTTSTHIRAT
jgi:hypothetical protein